MRRLVTILAAACVGLLAMATPAAADPVTALTTVFTGLGASAGAASLLASVSSVALSIGLNYAAQALFAHPAAAAQQFAVHLQMQTGGVVPRSFLLGSGAMTPGSLIYHGATAAGGITPNEFYVREIALSDIPIAALTGGIANGAVITYDPEAAPAPNDFGIAIPEYRKNGVDHLWVTFSDGTQTAPDPFMVAWFGEDPDYPYTSDMIGRGIAKVRIVARVNQELWPGNPEFKWICDGVPLYDLRYDTTAGGSGSQRWSTTDKSTWELRSDPAAAIYNITRGIYYAGTWFYGGQNLPAALLPFAAAAAAANECDADIDLAAGGTEKQFRIAGEIAVATRPVDAIETLLRCCNGRMAEIGGVYKYVVGAPGAPVLSFTDDDIIVTEEQEFDPFPDLDGTINGITARYPEPSDGYELRDAPPLYDTSLETEDGGRRLIAPVTYDFVTRATIVQRLMQHAVAEARRFRKHNQVMPPSCYELEPLDVVSWTSARNGYDEKSFRIDAATDGDACDQAWSITEVDPADAGWNPETDERPTATGTLVVQRPAVQAMVDWAVSGVAVQGDGGRARPALRLVWNPAVVDVAGVQFQVRRASDSLLVLAGETQSWMLGHIDLTQNIVGGTNYEARGRYLPVSARDTAFSSWLPATTDDIGIGAADLDVRVRALLQQLDTTREAALGPILDELRARVAALGQTTAGLVALLNERVEGGIVNYIGEANASITEVRTVAEGLADLFTSVFVDDEVRSANALLRLSAGLGPGGAGVSIAMQARAIVGDIFKSAGIEIYAAADEDGGEAGVILRGDKVLIQPASGDPVNALLLAVQDAPRDAPITTEGGDKVIRANLTAREQRHSSVIDDDVEMRPPVGPASMDYTHDVELDGSGHTITFSDEFLDPHPTGMSTLDGAINQFTISVKSTNPLKLTARFDGSYTETPILQFRDSVTAVASGSGTGITAASLAGLDFQPGSLLVAFGYAAGNTGGGGFGTWANITDASAPDWSPLASDSKDGNTVNTTIARRIRAAWKIAAGDEASVQLFSMAAFGASPHWAQVYEIVAFDMLGGTVTPFDAVADDEKMNAALATQTVGAAAKDAPVVVMSFAAQILLTFDVTQINFSFSETADQTISVLDGFSGAPGASGRLRIKRFTSSPADVTASKTSDAGSGYNGHGLLSCGFYLT